MMYKEYEERELQQMNRRSASGERGPVSRAWDFTVSSTESRAAGKPCPTIIHVRQIGEGPDAQFIYRRGKAEKIVRGWGAVSMMLSQDGYTGDKPSVMEYATVNAQGERR